MQRHFEYANAERSECIIQCRSKQGWNRYNAGFTRAFDTQWIQWRGRFDMIHNQRRYLCCGRDQVVHEACIGKLSLFIIHQPFKKSSADALCHASMHLPFDHYRIDYTPAIMHSDIFQEFHITCGWINLDNGTVNTTGKATVWRAIEAGGLKARAATFCRKRWARARPRQFHRHQLTSVFPITVAQGI